MSENEKIILGDQSPWLRGLLRYKVLLENPTPTFKNIVYFLHDYDSPWCQQGEDIIRIKGGWPNYYSLGIKLPFFPDHPYPHTPDEEKFINRVINSINDDFNKKMNIRIRGIRGLNYITGPTGPFTILSERKNKMLIEIVKKLITLEIKWLQYLADRDRDAAAVKIEDEDDDILTLIRKLGSLILPPTASISSSTSLFSSSAPLTLNLFPPSYFWRIDRYCYRFPLTTSSSSSVPNIVPKGEILPIEFALRGWRLGVTNIPYLKKTIFLRDKFAKGTKIKILKISFSWKTPIDEIDIKKLFYDIKKRRDPNFYPPPQWETYWRRIKSYWEQNPTLLGYLILGGDLNPIIVEEEY